MSELKWHKRFLRLAKEIGSWSKDPNHQVGCVLVDEYNRIISTGYNGSPRDIDIYALEITLHAEINALILANRPAVTAYCWPFFPCSQCGAALIQAGCQRIISIEAPSPKWRFDLVEQMCEIKNVELIQFSKSIVC